jgi:hypothetical protein
MAKVRLPKLAGKPAAKAAATSSTYESQGIAQPPTSFDVETGSSQPVRILELVPELISPFQRARVYAQMMNDAGVDVSMRAAKTPVLGAEYYVEPYSDSQEDADIASFIEANLFGGMSAPFVNSLEDILHMYEDGYAVLYKVFEERQWTPPRAGANGKTYTMLKKLAVRPPSTIKNIDYDDNGGPVTINQSAIKADGTTQDVQLKIDEVLLFTFGRKGGDLTGRSLLRTAYQHWYYKKELYKIDAIQKERHSLGVPRGKLLPGYKPSDKTILRTLLRNIRSNEEAFVLQTPNVEIDFMELPNNLVNVLESANHHNIMILMNVMAQFLALGVESSGGGRATGGAQTDIFMKALKFVANYIADVFNMYSIPELVVWNFSTNNFPKLRVRNIGETRDLQMLGSALANMFARGAITTDRETENWVRRTFDMPQKLATEPAIDPNTTQQATVTLYDAAGNAVAEIPTPNGVPGSNGNSNGSTQKGDIKQNGGQGNIGKPATSAFSESHIHLPPHVPAPVDVNNHYDFAAPPIELHVDEGAITAPAPIIHIHMPEQADQPTEVRPRGHKVKRDPETNEIVGVEYEY